MQKASLSGERYSTARSGRRFPHLIVVALETLLWISVFGILLIYDEIGWTGRTGAALSIFASYLAVLALTGKPRLSAVFTGVFVFAIAAISWTKLRFLGVPFIADDLLYLTGHSLWVTLQQYKSVAIIAVVAVLLAIAGMVFAALRDRTRVSWLLRITAAVTTMAILPTVAVLSKPAFLWDPKSKTANGVISTFANSAATLINHGNRRVVLADVGGSGLPESFIGGAASEGEKPDIFMVLDESVFDPQILDLPTRPELSDYFSPSGGLSGRLSVDVHGGGTWVSEFAVATGIGTASFGDQAYYLPVLMEGRVRHSLFTHLKSLGYETVVVYCMDGRFMNAQNNYMTLGIDEFHGSTTKDNQPGTIWYRKDRAFYEQALETIDKKRKNSDNPVFVLVVTISNHGPHGDFRRDRGDQEIRDWIEKHAPGEKFTAYRDYYLRLQDNYSDYRWLRGQLRARAEARPVMLARFGDHQPQFTKEMAEALDDSFDGDFYTTQFSIEGFNMSLQRPPLGHSDALDISYLPTLLLAAAGLERDALFEARLELMRRCGGAYASCNDPLKGQIHRTLIDQGLLSVDGHIPQAP